MTLPVNNEIENTLISETKEILSQLENKILLIEENPDRLDNDCIKEMLRNIHTLKGSAGFVENEDYERYIHDYESIAKKIFERKSLTKTDFEFLLQHLDYIRHFFQTLVINKEPLNTVEYKNAYEKIKLILLQPHTTSAINEGYGFFFTENVQKKPKPQKKIIPQETIYYLQFKLSEERTPLSWMPEDIINEIYHKGKILKIIATPHTQVNWKKMKFFQCFFGWKIFIKTDKTQKELEDIFIFHQDPESIRIKKIDENNVAEIIKENIRDTRLDNEFFENLLKWAGNVPQENQESAPPEEPSGTADRLPQPELNDFQILSDKITSLANTKTEPFLVDTKAKFDDELKISTTKVEKLIDLIGELIINNSQLNNLVLQTENIELDQIQYNINKISKNLRDVSLSMKLVPIGHLLSGFRRIIRDLAKEFNKEISLNIRGENTEIDKTFFSALHEIILHIVRNSIDHGIETKDERLKKGKEITGKISLNAYEESGQIIIEIEDDGRGLDRDKIYKKGIEKKILSPTDPYSDEEIYNLIFQSDFSTKDQVNLISGRGIGMDAVSHAINKLNGSIKFETQKNRGTKFIIRLPLTLAIIDGFLMKVGPNHFVIPLNFIIECFEANFNELKRYKMKIKLRDDPLVIIQLDHFLHNIKYENSNDPNKAVCVIEYDKKRLGILVDQILGKIQVVIKPVPGMMNKEMLLLGSTVLGTGEVALIFDLKNLLKKYRSFENKKNRERINQPNQSKQYLQSGKI